MISLQQLRHSLTEPEVVGVFTDHTLLSTLSKVVSKCPLVKLIIYHGRIGDKEQAALDQIKAAREDIQVVTLEKLKQIGRKENIAPTPPTEDGEWQLPLNMKGTKLTF